MTVARRFIAGSGTTSRLHPGGTPEYRRAINPKILRLRFVIDAGCADLTPKFGGNPKIRS
jgi:hypothetical protein